MAERAAKRLHLPVVAEGAEHLVMGYLMRRNVLVYKAPAGHEGYDLVCLHPDPRRRPRQGEREVLRVQVKSRAATDCAKAFPIRRSQLDAFDYLVVAFLNLGRFARGRAGDEGAAPVEFFTFPNRFVRRRHDASTSFHKVRLGRLTPRLDRYKNDRGFEQIAAELGVPAPTRDAADSIR